MPQAKKFYRYKPASRASRPHKLTIQNILDQTEWQCGVYWIIATIGGVQFVAYVGRSKSDIADRILKRMDNYDDYSHFRFRPCANELKAFHAECEEFHRYGGKLHLDNEAHPPRPIGHRKRGRMCSVPTCEKYHRYR